MRFTRLASIVRWMIRRDRTGIELDEELRTFVEMAAADHVRDGATPDEARRLAMLSGRHGGWLDAAVRDIRYGWRQVRRDPGFSAVAVLPAIASDLLTALLFGFQPSYVPAAAAVPVLLLAVATFACLVPALRVGITVWAPLPAGDR